MAIKLNIIREIDKMDKKNKFKVGDMVIFKTQKHLDPARIDSYDKVNWSLVSIRWHWWTEDALELYYNIKNLQDFKKLEVGTYLRNVFSASFKRKTLGKVAKIIKKNTTWFDLEYVNELVEGKNRRLEFPNAKNFYVEGNRVYISDDIWLILVYDILWKDIDKNELSKIETENIIFDIPLSDISKNNVIWVQDTVWIIQTNKKVCIFTNEIPYNIIFKWDRLDFIYISSYDNKNKERNMTNIYVASSKIWSWAIIYKNIYKKFGNLKIVYNEKIEKNLILWDWKYYELDYFKNELIEYKWELQIKKYKTQEQIDNEIKEKQKQEDIKNKKAKLEENIKTMKIEWNEENIEEIKKYLDIIWMQIDKKDNSFISDIEQKDIFIRTSNIKWIREQSLFFVGLYKRIHIEINKEKEEYIKKLYNGLIDFVQSLNKSSNNIIKINTTEKIDEEIKKREKLNIIQTKVDILEKYSYDLAILSNEKKIKNNKKDIAILFNNKKDMDNIEDTNLDLMNKIILSLKEEAIKVISTFNDEEKKEIKTEREMLLTSINTLERRINYFISRIDKNNAEKKIVEELNTTKLKEMINVVNNKIGNKYMFNINLKYKNNFIFKFESDWTDVFITNVSKEDEDIKQLDNFKIDINKLTNLINSLPEIEKEDMIKKINEVDVKNIEYNYNFKS